MTLSLLEIKSLREKFDQQQLVFVEVGPSFAKNDRIVTVALGSKELLDALDFIVSEDWDFITSTVLPEAQANFRPRLESMVKGLPLGRIEVGEAGQDALLLTLLKVDGFRVLTKEESEAECARLSIPNLFPQLDEQSTTEGKKPQGTVVTVSVRKVSA